MNKILELLKDIEEKTKELQELIQKDPMDFLGKEPKSEKDLEINEQGYQPEKN